MLTRRSPERQRREVVWEDKGWIEDLGTGLVRFHALASVAVKLGGGVMKRLGEMRVVVPQYR